MIVYFQDVGEDYDCLFWRKSNVYIIKDRKKERRGEITEKKEKMEKLVKIN